MKWANLSRGLKIEGSAMRLTILSVISIVMFLPVLSGAQQATSYSLTTNPAGATASFSGEYNLVVNTPANLPANLSGKYKVRICRPGYETWKGELSFLPGSASNVNVNLSKKTRFKAGIRSMLIPGWGQHYSGNSFRGAVFTLGAIGAATGFYFADRRFSDKKDDYNIALQNYYGATSIDELNRLRVISESARKTASDAEKNRNLLVYTGVGIWVYNFFDSVIFFPEGSAYYPALGMTDQGDATISLVVKF